MPRSLVLGNGNLLIGLDPFAQVRDFYYPEVGQENQVGEHFVHKIGVWVDDQFSWIDDGSWQITINYQDETLVGDIEATNPNLHLRLNFTDVVYNETDIFIREVTINNLSDQKKTIKIYFHQEFQIYESWRGDTGYYDPTQNVLVHYKGRRTFLINAVSEFNRFDDFCVGNFNIEGKEGTFKDAEDGMLSKNGIEHGQVDSVLGLSCMIDPESSQTIHYWIAGAKSIKEAYVLNSLILEKTPQHIIKTTADFWRAWVNKQDFDFTKIDESIVRLFKKSLLIIRTHVDNRGAIVASGDSQMLQLGKDNYSYMWPRDGALVAIALDQAGDFNVAHRFFDFCNEVITDEGYFMHKYRSDRSLGSSWHPFYKDGASQLPIQEDETALVVIALWDHFEHSKDLEFIESIYNSLIKKAVDWMISYVDPTTNLPKPSYDLWEEKFGTHTFTVATVYGALVAGSKFAKLLGKFEQETEYLTHAQRIKNALLQHLYDEKEGYFVKMINFKNGEKEIDYTLDSSSAYGVFRFGILELEDERLLSAMKKTEMLLSVPTQVGGLVRFYKDHYYHPGGDVVGNPWFITTLWKAQFDIAQAKSVEELENTMETFSWVVSKALPSGILSEQLNAYTGEQISAGPLTWSHAEFVVSVLKYMEKLKSFDSIK